MYSICSFMTSHFSSLIRRWPPPHTKNFLEEEDMILLGIRTETQVIDARLHLRITGDSLLYNRPTPQYVQRCSDQLLEECRGISNHKRVHL